jgi:hypothetical protein
MKRIHSYLIKLMLIRKGSLFCVRKAFRISEIIMIESCSKLSVWLIMLVTVLTISTGFTQPLDVIWDRSGTDPDSHFGMSLYPLGDQNDDGFADWMVWCQAGDVGTASESMVQLFHGGDPPPNEPYLTILAPRDALELAYARSVGDLNGDGYIDWFVGIRYENNVVYSHEIYWGGSDSDSIPDFQLTVSNYTIRNQGHAFDFNGDEFDDIYIYNYSEDKGRILYGGSVVDTIPDWELSSPPGSFRQALPSSFGDLNNDGFDDFVSYDTNTEQIWILTGSSVPSTSPAITLNGYDTISEAILDDLNGDGFDDLIILQETGQLTVHLGSPELLLEPSFEVDVPGCISQPTFHSAGDFNADGYNDFMVVDYACNQGWGVFNMFMGTRWHEVQHAFTIWGRDDYDLVGIRYALGPGDINGDGIDDIIIGATNNDNDGRRGRAVALAGDSSYRVPVDDFPPVSPTEFDVSVYPNPFNAQTTIEFDIPPGSSRIEITVFNTLGQTALSENLPAMGTKMRYFLNAESWSSGTYFLHVNTSVFDATKKLVVIK